MALTSMQQTTLTGTSTVDGKQVASMTAAIAASGSIAYLNININDATTYSANKATVRADITAFLNDVYAKEDEMSTTTAAS